MNVWLLFAAFFKIGLFSFGGGYAMIPLIEAEIIRAHGWLTPEQFVDIIAVAEMTPGPVAVNSATFVGYRVCGVFGAAAATLGVVLPSLLIMTAATRSFLRLRRLPALESVLRGIRPVVVALVASAAIFVARSAVVDGKGLFILALAFAAVTSRKVHPIAAIAVAAFLGLLLY